MVAFPAPVPGERPGLSGLPRPQGLYDARQEHDACGVAFVATLSGEASHDIVVKALTALRNLEHRGARPGRNPNSGDGAGILLGGPATAFFDVVARECDFELPGGALLRRRHGASWTGDADEVAKTRSRIEEIAARRRGSAVLGWREVPGRLLACLGATARSA